MGSAARAENEGAESPLRVLFVHVSHPNTFTRVGEALAERPGLRCAFMVESRYREVVRAESPSVSFFCFETDMEGGSATGYRYGGNFDGAMRRGVGVARALRALPPYYRFDVIVGSATTGAMLCLRGAVSSALVAYTEQPGFCMKRARQEFPFVFDQYLQEIGHQAMVLTSFAHADLAMVASEHARSLFPSEIRSKIRVQSEGFVLPEIPEDDPALRARLELPPTGPIIGFFGRTLEAVRGFDIFVQVARKVRQQRPEVHALVIGREGTVYGNEALYLGATSFKRHALAKAGADESEFIWRDFLPYDDFLAHLACLDVAILPTFEGASNWSFFDAMAARVPILSSNRSYVPELIRDGQEGYLFDPYDVDGYMQATLRLLDQPEEGKRIGRKARERIRRHHTPERAADGYERIIREAHARRFGPADSSRNERPTRPER